MDIIGIPVDKYSRILIFKSENVMKETVSNNPHIEEIAGTNNFSGLFMAGVKKVDSEG